MTELSHPYLQNQIIAYIGNKRRLLPLINEAVNMFYPGNREGLTFLDIFSGSGVVARMAKLAGFSVIANDWEIYSSILNSGFLLTDKSELSTMYKDHGGIDSILNHLNNLNPPKPENQYIAKHYSATHTDPERANFRTERLFYTRENGLKIDAIRSEIENLYPNPSKSSLKEKNLLLALLLYRAATHTNTSGVFKAYHKGFGGHGKDALTRILRPIILSRPELINSEGIHKVFQEDANTLINKAELQDIDIAYLDPPYNQHQYGSNYHMLKTIALWDKLEVNNRMINGVFQEKAAIRKDWTDTRSAYCYKKTASEAFNKLLFGLKAKHIFISYSTEGIIPFKEMKELCLAKGKVDIVTNEYTKYRGGRQSNSRLNKNIEFIITIDTGIKGSRINSKIDYIIEKRRTALLWDKIFRKDKLNEVFSCSEGIISTEYMKIQTKKMFSLIPDKNAGTLSLEQLKDLDQKLQLCVCLTRDEELDEIIKRIELEPEESSFFLSLVPPILRKLAHKKYKIQFYNYCAYFKKAAQRDKHIQKKLNELYELAEKRFNS